MTEPQGFRHTDCRPLGYLEKRLSLGAQKCWDRGKMSRIDVSGSRSPWSYGKQRRFQGPYTHRFWFRAHMEARWSASLTSSEVGNLGVLPFENYWNRLPLWKKKTQNVLWVLKFKDTSFSPHLLCHRSCMKDLEEAGRRNRAFSLF